LCCSPRKYFDDLDDYEYLCVNLNFTSSDRCYQQQELLTKEELKKLLRMSKEKRKEYIGNDGLMVK
jgi:hypothetical protein